MGTLPCEPKFHLASESRSVDGGVLAPAFPIEVAVVAGVSVSSDWVPEARKEAAPAEADWEADSLFCCEGPAALGFCIRNPTFDLLSSPHLTSN